MRNLPVLAFTSFGLGFRLNVSTPVGTFGQNPFENLGCFSAFLGKLKADIMPSFFQSFEVTSYLGIVIAVIVSFKNNH